MRLMPGMALAAVLLLHGGVNAVAATAETAGPLVVESVAAGQFLYLIEEMPCADRAGVNECPLRIVLLRNGKRLDVKTLPVAAAARGFTRETSGGFRLATGLKNEPGLRVWESGEEENYLAFSARLVRLGESRTGLLVTELYGFSHLHRAHALYAEKGGKLKVAWSFVEGGGPVFSSVRPLPGELALLFRQVQEGYAEEMPDSAVLSLLRWREGAASVTARPLPVKGRPLYLVSAGVYSSVSGARKAAAAMRGKGGVSLLVLAAKEYPQAAGKGEAVLGELFVSRTEARALRKKLRREDITLAPRIVTVTKTGKAAQ